jgi:pimeloyl-ACP methyl ester carboxylesterase
MRIALAALLLAAAMAAPAAARAGDALRPCRLLNPLGTSSLPARCGRLDVPENPAAPHGARLRLRYAIVRALDGRHATPLFVLAGGPGQAATALYAGAAPAFAWIHRHRDIVLLDQRGTGGSSPLACRYPEDFDVGAAALAQAQQATRACLAKYGDRVRFYTTQVAIGDLDALRRRLGLARIDLYGSSYGTRVAIEYMRWHPAAVRAAILDGVIDPTQPIGPSTPLDGERALQRIVARCAHTPGGAAAVPQLATDLATLRRRFGPRTVPVTIMDPRSGTPLTVPFSASVLATALRFLSYDADEAALLPLLIHEGAAGELGPLAAQAVLTTRRVEGQIAIGMQNSVVCSEDVPDYDPRVFDSAQLTETYQGTEALDELRSICSLWPRGPVDPALHAPLHSAIPTLLLAGEDDPVTPPAQARAVAAGLSDSRLIVLAGEGHGQLATACVPRLMERFLATRAPRHLDTACLWSLRPSPFFVSPAGPAP